jgi:hypothetical protein
VRAQHDACVRDGLGIGVQVTLGGDQRAVPGDLPEHADRDTSVGHPGKPGVPQVVTAQMLIAELGDHLIPMGRVAEHSRGDPAAARSLEDPCLLVVAHSSEALLDQRADLFNQRDSPGPLALGALVDETTGAWCGLPPDRPGPGIAVNIGTPVSLSKWPTTPIPDAGHFADPGCGAGGEDDYIAPALEVIAQVEAPPQ